VPVAQRRIARRTSELGTLYKGREGQWSWVLHRVTGVVVILFLFAHVLDTALVGWGPNAYNRVVNVYKNPIVGVMELGLVAAVLFHALNGLRIMVIDFWPKTAEWNKHLLYGTVTLYVAAMIPISVVMLMHVASEVH
jgi:succinate dehydrogenase / fumarate reductase cytochrome b subunit